MTGLDPVASRSPDRTGVSRESRGPPSAREMTIGQGSPSPKRADKGRIATYRAGLRLDLSSVAPCATVVGNRDEPSGESRFDRLWQYI